MGEEPLGYRKSIKDITIEFNFGGNKPYIPNNKHTFKLKCLPYMVQLDTSTIQRLKRSGLSKSSDQNIDVDHSLTGDHYCSDSSIGSFIEISSTDPALDYQLKDIQFVDVTELHSAFLSNSQYVPCDSGNKEKTVHVEIISAKLSEPSSSTTSNRSQVNNKTANKIENHEDDGTASNGISERPLLKSKSSQTDLARNNTSIKALSLTSRPFVNYTLLIKNVPGIDSHPALIERRFSHFASLYNGLKNSPNFCRYIDDNQTGSFPKKILMGNYLLVNIAERCVEFSRLLNICLSIPEITRSQPFVSFLLDKELNEAHSYLINNDVENTQATIEVAFHIAEKLFLNNFMFNEKKSPLSNSVSKTSSESGQQQNLIEETAGAEEIVERVSAPSSCSGEPEINDVIQKAATTGLSQRLLVTFCILFTTYIQEGFSDDEFKYHVSKFCDLITSENFLLSIICTKHYVTIRACLLFLLNVNNEQLVSLEKQLLIKRCLEDVDMAHVQIQEMSIRKTFANSYNQNGSRVTKKDLTCLVYDSNFLSFQDITY